jgi:hypothetical protein
MVKIQLDNGYLDVKEGTDFPLNFGVAEIRDVSARSGAFSKSITLIGSANNNKLLNHYYDVNIAAGTFDLNALTTCSVLQNDIPILEDAYLQLISVNKVQLSDGYEEGVEYTVLVKDAQADFFTKISNAELTDIDLTDLNHTYNAANVVASFNNTVTDKYMYPLTFSPSNVLQLTDFRMAVYAKVYWDRIHATNGFSYEWTSLSDCLFDKCIIPYNGDQPDLDFSTYLVEAELSGFTATLDAPITSWTEVTDDEALFTPASGIYNPPFYIGVGQAVNYHFNIDCDVLLDNATGSNAYLVNTQPLTTLTALKYNVRVRLYKNGLLSGFGTAGAVIRTVASNPLPNGSTTLGNLVANLDIPVNNALPTDDIEIAIEVLTETVGTAQLSFAKWQDAAIGGSDVTITTEVDVNSIDFQATVSSNVLSFGQTIEANQFIPKKIKQKDFIKSICQMYNLFVEPDKDNPNKLIYKHRDDFYDDGATKDWTYKLAKDKEQELQFLPDLSAKKLLMTYKQDTDSYNVNYEKAVNEVYGQVEFTFDNEYIKGDDKKELIFSPTPTAWNSFGAVVPLIVGAAPKTNIRILLHNGTKTCGQFDVIDYAGAGELGETVYPMVSHFDDHFNPNFDINFAPCDYYYYTPIFALTNNNLFNLYWRRTIGQINSGKMLTAYFDLRENDIQKLKLSDKIRIDNSWWHINKVVDYNANKEQLTKVELISVDEEIEIPNFRRKVKITEPIKGTIGDLNDAYYKTNNVNYSESAVTIKGVGNLVSSGLKGVIVGNDNVMQEDGVKDSTKAVSQSFTTEYTEIGAWDMDTDATLNVTLNIANTQLISADVVIINDAQNSILNIEYDGFWRYASPTITLSRTASGTFDSVNYDDPTINRGFIKYSYIQ